MSECTKMGTRMDQMAEWEENGARDGVRRGIRVVVVLVIVCLQT